MTVLAEDVERISSYLDLSKHQFKDRYTFTEGGMRFLREPCIFYSQEQKGCTIYPVRPKVCHMYPLQVINGRYGVATGCPGAKMEAL